MVVPLFPPTPAGGLERQAHLLARELARQGDHVEVVSVDGEGLVWPTAEMTDGVRIVRHASGHRRGRTGPLPMASLTAWFVRYARRFDVCHIHNISLLGTWVATLANAMGVPTLMKLPSVGPASIPGATHRAFGRLWIRALLRADAVVAMSPASVAELRSIDFPLERILRVTNGVELPADARGQAPPPVEGKASRRALFVGRVEERKGIFVLLQAWARLCDEARPGWVLRVVGDGGDLSSARTMAAAHGLDVEFTGYRAALGSEYRAADLFVLPSDIEGNSNSLLEAMAHGLPVVATASGGTPTLLGREHEEWLVPPRDPARLAARLEDLMTDAELRARLGQSLRRRVEAHFLIEQVASRYHRAYELLAAGRSDEIRSCGSPLIELA
jgi:glycosyltransferase involved in cell wall biosynthesis